MKTEDQESYVQPTSDTSLATIVRSIAAVEDAYIAANGPLSERLMAEIQQALRAVVSPPWMVGEANGSVTVQHTSWRSSTNITHNDAWLELVEIATDDNDHSWIAAVTASGATRTGFQLCFRPGLPNHSLTTGEVKKAVEIGFELLNGGEAILLPLTLDRENLAQGFERDDFVEAMLPVTAAVQTVFKAQAELDRLIGLVRKRNGKAG